MRVRAHDVSKGSALDATTVDAPSGEVTLVPIEGGQRPTLLGLILSGRMSPDAGEVTLDGEDDPRALRRRVALVDAPDASAPVDDLPLRAVVHEELVFAGLRRPRAATRRLLADEDLSDRATAPMKALSAGERVRVLARTAAAHPDVDALVIVSPDRHGGDIASWLDVARAWASRDFAVIVIASAATVDAAIDREHIAR